jgi:hypothetical protein
MTVAALIASGWSVWRQYEAPEGTYRPPVTLESSQAVAKQTRPAQEGSADTATARATTSPATAVTSPATAVTSPATAPQKPLAQPSAQQSRRTPVETYNPPAANQSASNSAQAKTVAKRPAAPAKSTTRKPATSARAAAKPAPGTRTPQASKPHIPEPIGYWELPDAVRANVPEIKFSVLVYDEDPEGRFVLINGQRLGEGDELQQGLAVGEIRRDGVVFTYRLYRFFVGR